VQGKKFWEKLVQPQPVSPEYRQWCDRLIHQRFWLAIGLAFTYLSIQGLANFHEIFIDPTRLLKNLNLLHSMGLYGAIRQEFIVQKIVAISLLGFLILWWRSTQGRKYPELLLILMPWAISFIPEMIVGAFFGLPRGPSIITFMTQVVIAPIHWRLHLIAQLVPILFYFIVYPLVGLMMLAGQSIYSFSGTVQTILVCTICEIGVYVYEQSKQSELESNRRLQLCIHGITHDLRTPVMGSLMLLQSIQESTPVHKPAQISQAEMEQLIQGSNRLLGMMNRFLDPQNFSQVDLVLHLQPTHLSVIVATILQDLHSDLGKQNVQVNNRITADLPLIEVDVQQIERVFNNLIGNVISHNPSGALLTLDAVSIETRGRSRSMLKVIVQDDGVGIPLVQQETIFEPYARGLQTQYLPGLGLGLYICRQVVRAHGGIIGVDSLSQGTLFWFTLPLARA
jgi:signal transduction histidine kinase